MRGATSAPEDASHEAQAATKPTETDEAGHRASEEAACAGVARATPHRPQAEAPVAPKQRRKQRMHTRQSGKVKFFSEKGFGFLVPTDGSAELFFHISDLVGDVEPATGDAVTRGSHRSGWRLVSVRSPLLKYVREPFFEAILARKQSR
jgi:cold shock CspA family protein